MAIFFEELQEALEYYEHIADRFRAELDSAPDGTLNQQANGKNGIQFVHRVNDNGTVVRRGINRNKDMIRALARKEFAAEALTVLDNNITALRNAIDAQLPFDPDEILSSMSGAYSKLPEEYFFNRSKLVINLNLSESEMFRIESHREWGMQQYKESNYHLENKTQRTSRGNYVRSKAELLIIEKLYDYDIPHHYDEEHRLNGLLVVPDFTFQDRYKKLFYWDHLGMMDDPDYAKRNFRKLEKNYDAGLIPGDNLIVTFSKGKTINMGTVEATIRNEVLPRL